MAEDRFSEVELNTNPEQRCAVVLLLDTSGSMSGKPIQELNEGLRIFETSLKSDELASLRVEIAVITFGGSVRTLNLRGSKEGDLQTDADAAFVSAGDFHAPTLTADGETPMGEAMARALDLVNFRKGIYKKHGTDYYRPWILLLTDGKPTDTYQGAASRAREQEQRKGVAVYCVGVQGADMTKLGEFSTRQPLLLKGLGFKQLFDWLSKSLSAVSGSGLGDQAPLPPTGWAVADTSH